VPLHEHAQSDADIEKVHPMGPGSRGVCGTSAIKQKDKAGRPDIDAFEAVMMRENRDRGYFVSFDFSEDAERECEAFRQRSGRIIKTLTVREILDEQLARLM
jgi:hypothetical protein